MGAREKFYQWTIGILVGILIFLMGKEDGKTDIEYCQQQISVNDRRLVKVEEQVTSISLTLTELKYGQQDIQKNFNDLFKTLQQENRSRNER